MVGRWLRTLGVLVAMLAPGQMAWAQALPDLPPPPPPHTPPPPPPGLRPVVGADGRLVTDAQGRPQYVIDMPAPPAATMRPDNLPPVIMKHLTPTQSLTLPPVPGALPLPAGQTPAAATPGTVAPPPIVVPPHTDTPSTLPQMPPPSSAPVPAPPPAEGGRRPGAVRGI
jgi:hypothetical protein